MLDRSKGAMPLYKQLEEILKKAIDDGVYKVGELFPCEKELMASYEVSRITVRQAVAELSALGYLKGERGKGTTVIIDKINENLKSIVSFSQEMALHGVLMTTKICEVTKEKASSYIAKALNLEDGAFVIKVVRLRCASASAIAYSTTYLPFSLGLSLASSDYSTSLYCYLKDKGITVVRANDTLEAVLAEKDIADKLEIDIKSAVFKRTRNSFDEKGVPIEFSYIYYPGDKYKYNINL